MAVKFSVYYYFGAYLYKKDYKPRSSTLIISALVSVGCFGTVSMIYNLQNVNCFDLLIETLAYICSIAGIIMVYSFVSLIQEKLHFLLRMRIWRSLKNCSFGIYLFHQQIVYLTIICLNGKVHPIVQVITGFVFSVFISSAMVVLLRKWKHSRTLFAL